MMLMGLAMPAMIGAAGLAVDTTQWFLWKRELQHAVDQAAIAAAWARSNSNSQADYQTRGAQEYNANLNHIAGFASTPNFALRNYSNGTNNSVVVSASASKTLPFSSILLGSGVTIGAVSQASFAPGMNYQACLITIGQTGSTLTVGGNATVNARCGMAALSCSNDAIVIDGTATVIADSIATCGTATVPTANQGVVNQGVQGLTDQFADLSPPTNTTPRTYNCTGQGQNQQASLLPGTYNGLVVSCTTDFAGGIYVIDGGVLDLSANAEVTGTNVMFVLKNGATLKWGGSGNNNSITLTPMQAANFMAAGYTSELASRYANMLVFEDRNNNPTQDHIINGNSNSLMQGTIYLSDGTARINGTADIDSSCLQITAQRINVIGNASINTRCATNQTNTAGSAAATVRLVA